VPNGNNNHRKEKKDDPDYGNGPFGAPVEEDGDNNENSKPKGASRFEVSIDWKLEAERRAWLAALNEDIAPVRGLFEGGSDITDVV